MRRSYDVVVVGSGFAGSLMAMIAHRLGRSVALIEKYRHPRVVIGESSTPLTSILLSELATRYDLPALLPFCKWGSWRSKYPEIACGLKRGFTFYHHDRSRPDPDPPSRWRQLLVGASPHDEIADTHWYRADFDHFLVRYAQSIGVEYYDEAALTIADLHDNGITLDVWRKEEALYFHAKCLVDATGPRGFLHHQLGLKERNLPGFPETQALYSHFTGVRRLDETPFGNNLEAPPYPIDDAAVHHLFDGGWLWVLRFANGITSAGVAATDALAAKLNLAEGDAAWQRLLGSIPALEEQFATAKATQPFTYIEKLSFRSATIVGANWALLPSAAGFVDPLLSTGFPLTLLGIDRLAETIEKHWDSKTFAASLQAYARKTDKELLAAGRLIGGLYANLNDFPVFAALSMLYFASASYVETARRLAHVDLASSFLLHDHPVFGPAARDILLRAHLPKTASDSEKLIHETIEAIEPFNIGGFGNDRMQNWYPVKPQDLYSSAWKLGASRNEITALFRRCGFDPATFGKHASNMPGEPA